MEHTPVVAVTFNTSELDEFTLWRRMFGGLVAAGAIPLAIDCRLPQPALAELIERVDGVMISGGGDVSPSLYGGDPEDSLLRGVNPDRDANEIVALNAALSLEKPVLAICRGAQLVNVALGGTLYADIERDLDDAIVHRHSEDALVNALHSVEVNPESQLATWLGTGGELAVNSQHHQGIRSLAEGLVPTAFSLDGLVEAFESTASRLVAIQWHPEIIWPTSEHARALLRSFVLACGQGATERVG